MEYTNIIFSMEENIATITLNRPKSLNSLTAATAREILDALQKCEEQNEIRTVVITGMGRGFSAGGDLKGMEEKLAEDRIEDFWYETLPLLNQIILRIQSLSKPVIAAINGVISGGAFNLALACDLRIAVREAKFIQAFANVALGPDMGGSYFLPRYVGVGKALELLFSDKPIVAEEAARLGLVNWVVDASDFEAETKKLAQRLSQGATLTLAATKKLVYEGLNSTLATQLEKEFQTALDCSKTEDYREGITAFFAKSKPQFKGR
jgi:2-(1,2-epoxy-1,2-dihydrophenyl)acetyl-CoA isomerase